MRSFFRVCLLAAAALLAAAPATTTIWLPTLWRLSLPAGPVRIVGLFPQGIALSPDGKLLAIVESGLAPPSLTVLDAATLAPVHAVTLAGAFGRPVWLDASHVLVAGENDDAIENVDIADARVARVPVPKGSWPAQVALFRSDGALATSDDMTGNVSLGNTGNMATVHVGRNPSDLLFSADGKRLYVALRGESRVAIVNVRNHDVAWIAVGLHPDALALSKDGKVLYVAESDDDALGVVDLRTRKRVADIDLSLHDGRTSGYGASPNAIAVGANNVYVSLGAENAIAVVRNRNVAGRIPTGWYPSGIALGAHQRLYVADAKGESSPANPGYNPYLPGKHAGYVGASLDGSIRVVDARALDTAAVVANASQDWVSPLHTVIRPNGPIEHVIYIIKENRTYDQVLGDVPNADGDPGLTWFGPSITPNQHAIVRRFGVFDRAFADAQISADGHNWSTAAIANDYVERFWPQNYSGRDPVYDFEDGDVAGVPHNGYLWDDAARAGITYRDYGEFVEIPSLPGKIVVSHMAHLADGHVAPHYPGWNLDISDQVRYEAWKAEFDDYVARQDLPQLEIVRLPNDHTMGTRPGALTPQAYVAQNDYALGEIVDAVSHSPYWATTAIFAIEDDAQNGPDHVDDQRTTLYVASPYAMPGTHHTDYTTASVLHTIEILLGMQPMTIYDAVAQPLYAAFALEPVSLQPYDAIPPRIDVNATNSRTAYGAAESMRLDFRNADEADPAILNDILAHASRERTPAAREGASR
jgi:DNA-binding beta-propeller fold protein YncE